MESNNKSMIIVAHGSKKDSSNNEVSDIVKSVSKSNTQFKIVEEAFLEFAEPNLEKSVNICIKKGSMDISIYPYFLNSGKHVTVDLPRLVKDLKEKHPKVHFSLLPHFGQSKTITEIILTDIRRQ